MSIKSKIEELEAELQKQTGQKPRINIDFHRIETEAEAVKIVNRTVEGYDAKRENIQDKGETKTIHWYSAEPYSRLNVAAFYKRKEEL